MRHGTVETPWTVGVGKVPAVENPMVPGGLGPPFLYGCAGRVWQSDGTAGAAVTTDVDRGSRVPPVRNKLRSRNSDCDGVFDQQTFNIPSLW